MPMPLKKVLITIPESLLKAVDSILSHDDNLNRSELIRNLLTDYVKSSKVKAIEAQLVEGYQSMGALNLELAEYNFDEMANLEEYERYLSNPKYAT